MIENTNDTQVTNDTTSTAPVVESTPSTSNDAPVVEATPAYVPDYKYKYTGRNGDKWGDAEGEIDESIRPLIKSKEDEEKWKKHFSKVMGFDFVADGREKARTEYTQYKTQAEPILKYAQEATKHYKAGDMDSFFEVLGVPYEKLQQYVYGKLKQQELPPEHRSALEEKRALNLQLQQMQEQLQSFHQNSFQNQQQAIYNEVDAELSKPDIKAIAQAFDQRSGQPGSFQNEIIQRGHLIYTTQGGRIARPGEIVQDLITRYGLAASPQASTQPQTNVVGQRNLPTIPVVAGGGASPVKKRVSSVADIETEYNKL